MAWQQSTDGGMRRLFSEGLFKPFPITMVWHVYVDSLGTPDFGTMMAVGPTTFGGINYYVCFHDKTSTPQKWSLGAEGTDALGSSVVTGQWYRQGFRATKKSGTGYDLEFWPNLPDTEVITRSETAFDITSPWPSGHEFYFGKVPWNANEFLRGRMAGMKIWQALLPLGAITREVASVWPVLPQYAPALWAVIPSRHASDRLDHSGSGRHFTPVGTLTGTW